MSWWSAPVPTVLSVPSDVPSSASRPNTPAEKRPPTAAHATVASGNTSVFTATPSWPRIHQTGTPWESVITPYGAPAGDVGLMSGENTIQATCGRPCRLTVQRGKSAGRQRTTWWPSPTSTEKDCPGSSGTWVSNEPLARALPSTATVVPGGAATFTVTGESG